MPESFRFRISVECDVMNADSEAIARTAAFALLTQMQAEKKKGRPSSDAKATITGVRIEDPAPMFKLTTWTPETKRQRQEQIEKGVKIDAVDYLQATTISEVVE